MSNTVDNRIVQLEMENSKFEKNAKKSTATLHELDNALDLKNGKKSFDEIEKAAAKVNFEPLMKAAQTATTYMSNMGVAATAMIQNITNKVMDGAIQIGKSLSVDQITTGYSKYEQKTANVQTLVNATGKSVKEINGYLDRLMWFSDETSYGFTDMTQALSTMVTSGGDIGKLIPMIEGMANATAFAGKGASEFNRVIYNLNQSYSQGYLSYQDWKSVQMAGASSKQLIETLISAGEQAGTIKKGEVTVDNFTNTLSKQWATREVMENGFAYFDEMTEKAYQMIGTMDESGNKIETASQAYDILSKKYKGVSINAAKAAQEAKSFTEAVDSTKDAVSSGWMRTFELIFGNYSQAKVLWTDMANGLWDIFASGFEGRNNFLEEVFQKTPVENLMQSVEDAGVSFENFKRIALETGEAFGEEITDTMRSASDMQELLELTGKWLNGKNLSQIIRKAANDLTVSSEVATETVGDVKSLLKDINSGKYGYGLEEQARRLSEAGFGDLTAWDIQQWYNAVGGNIEDRIDEINKSLGKVEKTGESITENEDERIQKLKENRTLLEELAAQAAELDGDYYNQNTSRTILIDSLKNALGAAADRMEVIRRAWKNVFPAASVDQVKNLIAVFHRFTETLALTDEGAERIESRFSKLFTTARKVSLIFGDLVRVGGAAIGVAKRFIQWFLKIPEVASVSEDMKSKLNGLFGLLDGGLDNAHGWLGKIITYLDSLDEEDFNNLLSKLQPVIDIFKKIGDVGGKAFRAVSDAASKFWQVASPILSQIGQWLLAAGGYIYNNLVAPIGSFLSAVISSEDPIKTLMDGFTSLGKKISGAAAKARMFVAGLISGKVQIADIFPGWDKFQEVMKPVTDMLGQVRDRALEAVRAMDFSDVVRVLAGVGLVYGLSKISNALTNIGNLATTVQTTFKNINTLIRGKFTNNIATNLKAIATAVTAIALAFKVISEIPVGELKKSAVVLGSLLIVMGALAGAMTFAATKLGQDGARNLVAMAPVILAFSVALLLLSAAVKNVSAALSGTTDMWGRVLGILATVAGLGGILVAMAGLMSLIGGKITVAAVAILIISFALNQLTKALGVLGTINLTKDAETLLSLLTIVGVLSAVIGALGKIGGGATAKVRDISISVLAIVAAAYVLQQLVTQLNKSDPASWTTATKTLLGMVILMGVVAGFAVAIGIMGSKLQTNTKSVLAISIGVFAMIGAMALLERLFERISAIPMSEVKAASLGLVVMGGCISAIVGFLGLASKLSNGGKGMLKISFGVLGIIAGMYVMLDLFRTIAKVAKNMDDNDITNGVAGIFGFTIIMCALLASAGSVSKMSVSGMASIIAVVLGVVAILYAVEKLTDHDWNELWPVLATVGGILLALSVVFLAVSKITGNAKKANPAAAKKSVWPMVGFILVVGELIAAFKLLDGISWQSMAQTAAALSVTLFVLYGVIGMISKFSPDIKVGPIFAMAAVIAAIAGTMALLRGTGWDELLPTVLSMAGVIVALGGALALSNIGSTKSDWTQILAMAVTAGVIGVALNALANKPWNALAAAAGSMTAVLLAIGRAMAIGGKTKVESSAIVGMVAVAVAAAGSIAVLASFDWQSLLAAVIAFLVTAGILVGALALISKINASLGQIASFAAVAGTISLAFIGIAFGLQMVAGIDTGKILSLVGIIGGLIAIITLLAGIGAAVLGRVPTAIPVLLSLAAVIVSVGTSVMFACAGIARACIAAAIAVDVFVSAFARFMGVIVSLEGHDLTPIADGLKSLAGAVALLGLAFIAAALGVVGMVAVAVGVVALGLAGEVAAGGIGMLLTALVGLLNILSAIGSAWANSGGSLINGLASLREEMSKGAVATADFGEKIQNALGGGLLASLFSKGEDTGGAVTNGMAEGIAAGTPAVETATDTALTTMTESAVKSADEGGSKTADSWLTSMMSRFDGFFGGSGGNDLIDTVSSFWGRLQNGSSVSTTTTGTKSTSASLKNDAHEMVAFGEDVVTSAEQQGNRLTNVFDKLKSSTGSGGITETLKDMFGGSSLGSLAGGNVDYSSLSEGFSVENLSTAASDGGTAVVESYANSIAANPAPVKEAVSSITKQAFGDANETLLTDSGSIGAKLKYSVEQSINKIDWSPLSSLLETNLSPALTTAFESDTVTSGIKTSVESAMNTSISGVDTSESATAIANSLATNLGTSIVSSENTEIVKTNAGTLANSAKEGLKVDTASSGHYFAEGFGNGMSDRLEYVIAKATALGNSAVGALNAALDEHSPSKLTAKSGVFFAQGFGNGIADFAAYAVSMASSMGLRACDALENSIQNGNTAGIVPVLDMRSIYEQLAEFDGTYRPVIKPTLDLTDVNPGLQNMSAVTAANARTTSVTNTQASDVAAAAGISFVQNNYSPKALSRVEIYRQTRNQLTSIRGLVKA